MTRENYFHWGVANLGLTASEVDEANERRAYLECLTHDLRSLAGNAGFGTITEAVEAGVVLRTAVRALPDWAWSEWIQEQGIGE